MSNNHKYSTRRKFIGQAALAGAGLVLTGPLNRAFSKANNPQKMARIFITGSSDGLGLLAAKSLTDQGHQVVLHARNAKRKEDTLKKIQVAEAILIGDLSSIDETKALAAEVNKLGTFDAVIHNAGVYNAPAQQIFSVNVLAPYILTSLIQKPKRLIYLTSDMHRSGKPKFEYFKTGIEQINYSDSKLHVLMLCKAVARKWKDVYSNSVNPGWVPTKMGGAGAPDDLQKGYETQVWLATSNDKQAKVSGHYFYHQKTGRSNPTADDHLLQEQFLELCQEITGVPFAQ
ncbi:MAG: SDR family NAD(P)-dependent oxidoreductase [Niabella sp.]